MHGLLRRQILEWYDQHKRDLPWRHTADPYKIWISEVILQQTRVNQGLNYYFRFLGRFNDIYSLASAREEEVLKVWQGLGYYSRARNMHKAAIKIVTQFAGKFPDNYQQIIQLDGIGEYTASAIASICFRQPYPVLDGNVFRVVSRLTGIHEAVDTSAGRKKVKEWLQQMIDTERPGTFNQAMMELGATVCTPVNPLCQKCPAMHDCYAFRTNLTTLLPFKTVKKSPLSRYFNYLCIRVAKGNLHHLYIHKRENKDIWSKLYEFPLIEDNRIMDLEELCLHPDFIGLFEDIKPLGISMSGVIKHQLTHQTIYARFFDIVINEQLDPLSSKKYLLIEESDLQSFPVPKLIEKYFSKKKVDKKVPF